MSGPYENARCTSIAMHDQVRFFLDPAVGSDPVSVALCAAINCLNSMVDEEVSKPLLQNPVDTARRNRSGRKLSHSIEVDVNSPSRIGTQRRTEVIGEPYGGRTPLCFLYYVSSFRYAYGRVVHCSLQEPLRSRTVLK